MDAEYTRPLGKGSVHAALLTAPTPPPQENRVVRVPGQVVQPAQGCQPRNEVSVMLPSNGWRRDFLRNPEPYHCLCSVAWVICHQWGPQGTGTLEATRITQTIFQPGKHPDHLFSP